MASSIGLYTSFTPPGVHTQTLLSKTSPSVLGGIRIPMLIGPADECVSVYNEEVFRGSSSAADNPVFGEDLSSQVTGSTAAFTTSKYPIVDGLGSGTVTTDPNAVTVTVNGLPVVVLSVAGSSGLVTLQSIPVPGDEVRIDYFYKRSDTLVENEVATPQFGSSPVSANVFQTLNFPLVNGTGGGIVTTSPADVTVTVDGVAATVTAVDGLNGLITLESTPGAAAVVLVTYYYNQYRDTSDSLRFTGIDSILRVGNSPDRTDYVLDVDYTLYNDEIHWGSVAKVETGTSSPGSTPLTTSQLSATLVDDRVYLEQAAGTVDSANRTFTLDYPIVDGTGIGRISNSPAHLIAYVGTDPQDALTGGAVTVSRVTGSSKQIVLATAPAPSALVFVTYWRNRLSDLTFTVESLVQGGSGVGQYRITEGDSGAILPSIAEGSHTVADTDFGLEGVTHAAGTPQFLSSPGYAVAETVTLTFTSATAYTVSSSNPSGSAGTGVLDQTYEDAVTGLTFTILSPTLFAYAALDTVVFVCTVPGVFTAGATPVRAVPGVSLTLSTLTGVVPTNTATVSTFKAAGSEPGIGDYYYVTYEYSRTDYSAQLFTDFGQVQQVYGPLRVGNPLVLAGYLAFLQRPVAVGFKQVPRSTGSEDASAQSYTEALTELELPFGAGFTPDILVPMTTNSSVQASVARHCEIQSGPRFQNECTAVFGTASGTTPAQVKTLAESFQSRRVQILYPDTCILALEDLNGIEFEVAVDGTYLAAAYAGLRCFPDYDVAEPMTRKKILGFKRLARRLTRPEQNSVMLSGVTVVRELASSFEIIMSLSTDMRDAMRRSPNITLANDLVQQLCRNALDQFIGQKFVASVLGDVEAAVGAVLSSLVRSAIISEYAQIQAVQDEFDPTILRLTFIYAPIFPLNWIEVTINLQSRI